MKPLAYFHDTAAEGPEHFSQRFYVFLFILIRFFWKTLFRFKSYGADQLRLSSLQGAIIAGNHNSYLDPTFIMLAMRPRPVRFIAKEEFFKVKAIARMASWAGVFPIKRGTADMKAIKRAVAMLKRGELVGIFPEGTRGRNRKKAGHNEQRVAFGGTALIAHLARVPVVPVHLWNTERISPPESRLWHFPRITLSVGEPLSLTDERYANLSKDERFAAFTADIMTAIYAFENPRDDATRKPDEESCGKK